MIKVKCKYCSYKVEKPRWEHIIHTIRKQGGDILKNVCPGCKKEGLRFDWGENNEIGRRHNKKEIKLGDKPENLMRHDAYKRVNRRLRQIKWE